MSKTFQISVFDSMPLADETENMLQMAIFPLMTIFDSERRLLETAQKRLEKIRSNARGGRLTGPIPISEEHMGLIFTEIAHRSAVEGLCVGLIFTTDNMIRAFVKGVCREFKKDEWQLRKCDPKIGNTYWAEAIYSAANYIRHAPDWNETYESLISDRKKQKTLFDDNEPDLLAQFLELTASKFRDQVKRNTTALIALGFPAKKVLAGTLDEEHLVRALSLHSWEKTFEFLTKWYQAVSQLVREGKHETKRSGTIERD